MIILYLAQFHNAYQNTHHTFLVVARKTTPKSDPVFQVDRKVKERSELLVILKEAEDYLHAPDTAGLIKCRDTYTTQKHFVVREQDLVDWIDKNMPRELPSAYNIYDL